MGTTKTLRSLLISSLVLITVSSAQAAWALQEQIQEIQSRCPRLNCPAEDIWVVSMPVSEQKRLPKEARAVMKEQIEEMIAADWPEIMQRRSLKTLNRLRIDKFEKLVVSGQDRGYRVTYSDKTWDLKTCDYQDLIMGNLDTCQAGRVYESAFVDLDLQNPFHDEKARVRFRSADMGEENL